MAQPFFYAAFAAGFAGFLTGVPLAKAVQAGSFWFVIGPLYVVGVTIVAGVARKRRHSNLDF